MKRHFYAVEQAPIGVIVHRFCSRRSRDEYVAKYPRVRACTSREAPRVFGAGGRGAYARLGYVEPASGEVIR